jgi:cystathionine beta-lyase
MGVSWGGFESLVRPTSVAGIRTATRWDAPGPLLRLRIGLEDTDDLIADLEAGFERLDRAATGAAEGGGS